MKQNKNRKIWHRVISVITTIAIMTNILPVGELSKLISDLVTINTVAEGEVPGYTPTYTEFSNGSVDFETVTKFIDYCYYYSTSDSFANTHKNDDLILSFTNDEGRTLNENFKGLGNSTYPFNGSVRFPGSATFTLEMHRPFFSYVTDSVAIKNNTGLTNIVFEIKRISRVGEGESSPLLAEHVYQGTGANSGTASWQVKAAAPTDTGFTYSGVIGTLESNAHLGLSFNNESTAAIESKSASDNKDVGALCGKMATGSVLTVSAYTGTADCSITSASGNAGGYVGTMEGTASLSITSVPSNYAPAVTSDGGNAGGIIGELTSDAIVTLPAATVAAGNVKATNGAGGLFGYYMNKNTTVGFDVSTYYNGITARATGTYSGGLFGVFKNDTNENAYTVTFTGTNTSDAHKSGTDGSTSGCYGGLIGKYEASKLTDKLLLSALTFKSESAQLFASYGGAVGIVDSAAYIEVSNVTVTAAGSSQRNTGNAYFGGLIGETSAESGVFVDLGSFKLTSNDFCGGGVVGKFNNGVLRLSGTTDMSAAKPYGGHSSTNSSYGQLVGDNDNVLVYALGSGNDTNWTFKRSNGAVADDLGTWGEVVRMFGSSNAEAAGIIDSTNLSSGHYITVAAAQTSIGSAADFAKTALNIMLNQGTDYGCLKFTSGDANKRANLLSGMLTLTADIALSGTGINGFMRDGASNISASVTGSVGEFTGTLSGGNKTVTFAAGESYGLKSDGSSPNVTSDEGVGQIYRHQYTGLFAVIGNGNPEGETATVSDLELAGNIYVRNAGANGMSIGGIAARTHGSTALDGITANQTVNYYEDRDISGSAAFGKHLGGLIGFADNNTDNGTIEIKGTTVLNTQFRFSGKLKNYLMCGSAIGNVSSSKVNIRFADNSGDTCKVTMDIDRTGVAAGASNTDNVLYIGGLIGYISSNGTYTNKNIIINNTYIGVAAASGVSADPCTIVNPATSKAGGILGHSWYNANVTVSGLTVNNCTMTLAASDVGVMAYDATGKWEVDSLTVNDISMSSGGSASLGMLVNKAYSGTDGLYLDVLNKGYTLTDWNSTTSKGIQLPSSIGIYDELAVYSAENVLTGGAGVISINMNSSRTVANARVSSGTVNGQSVTGSGTYQNKLTSASSAALGNTKYANKFARYYYNLDKCGTTDAGENLLLWSVYNYAASNIRDAFNRTTFKGSAVISGNADMTGLSFYPLATGDNCTIGALTLKLDYSGFLSSGEAIFTNSTTDSYVRDPGDTTSGSDDTTPQNQHYLMNSGLFIDLPKGKTISITGELKLAGTLLELDGTSGDTTNASLGYSGALISRTMKGSLKCTGSGGIKLAGLMPETTGGTAYNSGYLLINNIKRDSELDPSVELIVQNLSTENYVTDAIAARSLFGAASGKDLSLKFSEIKLDSRTAALANSTANSALTTAYGTSRSIFSNAIFFESIHTNQAATLEYYFTWAQDWNKGRNVTYGQEIKNSTEYEDKEQRYSGETRYYVNPESNENRGSVYDFSSGFVRYVGQAYDSTQDANNCYYREIKVNVIAADFIEGCGTYNDPYLIKKGEQLEALSSFLISADPKELGLINLPKNSSDFDTLSENTTGNRWCTDKSGTGYHAEYKESGSTYFGTTSTVAGASNWKNTAVQQYLANAYYKISGNITLGSNSFLGLGGITNGKGTAFRGVIVGEKEGGVSKYTITNQSANPLVKVSNGCVIKDINMIVDISEIQLDQATNTYDKAYFGYEAKCKYYGGFIGEIMGGDNIIDNSYVSYGDSAVKLTGTYGTIVPVGGYVGVIVFGGLIFKNMTATETVDGNTVLRANNTGLKVYNGSDTATNLALDSSKADIYANPLVGRVINGYAVNESTQFSVTEDGTYHDDAGSARTASDGSALTQHTLKNGKKHYSVADINKNDTNKLDVTAVAASGTDGNINVPNAQAMFILSLITQSCAGTAASAELGAYNNSLSYGTYSSTVYGMSHIASYGDVGTGEASSDDFSSYASKDTAANTAIPYIIKYYTECEPKIQSAVFTSVVTEVKSSTVTTIIYSTATSVVTSEVYSYSESLFTGTSISDGDVFVIKGRNEYYLVGDEHYCNPVVNNRDYYLKSSKKLEDATVLHFEQNEDNSSQYCIWLNKKVIENIEGEDVEVQKKFYLTPKKNNVSQGSLKLSEEEHFFTISKGNNNTWFITSVETGQSINHSNKNDKEYCTYKYDETDAGNQLKLYTKTYTPTGQTVTAIVTNAVISVSTYVTTYTETSVTTYTTTGVVDNYGARCVVKTEGYYDINLTGSDEYVLPDSYRGLGCVGIYDTVTGVTNPYSIKLNEFDGNGKTINADIYLNKFKTDNYFNMLHSGASQAVNGGTAYAIDTETAEHGIGLFDSVIMKSGGKFYDFTLTGSVKTAIFEGGSEYVGVPADNSEIIWHSTGGVCGWSRGTQAVNFEKIILKDITLNGSNYVAGLLAHSGNKSPSFDITVTECSADNISLKLAASQVNGRPRNAMGVFIGKVKEGKAIVRGRSATNPDTTKISTVKINTFSFGNNTDNFYVSVGGLVGYSGHGFEAYDMLVEAKDSAGTTIGSASAGTCGGIIGVMQPYTQNSTEGYGMFRNCTVKNINILGNYAGGIYGGKWGGNNAYVPYRIEFDNCRVIGVSGNGNSINGGDSAGGLVGQGLVYTRTEEDPSNLIISNCKVSDYTINSNSGKYSGGFVGYCDSYASGSSITCYIHDSSVEDCVIGQSGNVDYAGGVIGGIAKKPDNKILGYNIKLDNVTSPSTGTNKKGAWIGFAEDTSTTDANKTIIQFAGMAVYGGNFTQNVGNIASFSDASFVFADYTEKSQGTTVNGVPTYPDDVSNYNNTGNVGSMPAYPYVNINPQSGMGTGQIISGDGAVLNSENASYTENGATKYFSPDSGNIAHYPSSMTMAAKIYADIKTGTASGIYTTFSDTTIYNSNNIEDYLMRGTDYDGDRISNYQTERGLPQDAANLDNFAVVVIANNNEDETTNLINRYIQLVTNTSTDYTDYSPYYNIVVTPYKYNAGAFSEETGGTSGLTWTAPVTSEENGQTAKGTFALNGSHADSKNTDSYTFSLVDVQFKDPFNTNYIAYHLYVPVYTIRQIEVEFNAVAISGANSVKDNNYKNTTDSQYEALFRDTSNTIHFDSLNTWITQYIRFTYKREDINGLLESGRVKWNHEKTFTFDTFSDDVDFRLPANTYMVLVDPNGNSDDMYYVDDMSVFETETDPNTNGTVTNTYISNGKAGWKIALNKFTDGTNNFEVKDLADILAAKIEAVDTVGGRYTTIDATSSNYDAYRITETKDASGNITLTKTYYRYVGNGNGGCNLVLPEGTDLYEDYYLSMYVPHNDDYNNEIYYYTIKNVGTFDKPANKAGASSAKVSCARANAEGYIMFIADLYTQDTTAALKTSSDEQMSESNKKITVEATTRISINNPGIIMHLSSADLYHSFKLSLTRYESNGAVSNNIVGLHDIDDEHDNASITAKYSFGEGTAASIDAAGIDIENDYVNIRTSGSSIMSALRTNQSQDPPVPLVINAKVEMDFDTAALDEEFPIGTSNSQIGVNVGASSNLSYVNDSDSLAFSSMTSSYPRSSHYYYRESVDTAHLYYSVTNDLDIFDYDGDDEMSQNHSRLGINALRSSRPEGMKIITAAKYNPTSLSGYANADHIRLTFSLSKKTDIKAAGVITGVEYQPVNLDEKLSGDIVFKSGTCTKTIPLSPSVGTFTSQTISGVTIASDRKTVTVDMPSSLCEKEDGIYTVNIEFDAITGSEDNSFTDYANYRVDLTTELYKAAENTDVNKYPNSGVSDWLIYTNAKVITSFIK